MIEAAEALKLLREGNNRFVSGTPVGNFPISQTDLSKLVAGQKPFAVILGCSDSRVPVEIIFNQGMGDLFVIRVAGNIVTPSQLGSIEFAVDRIGSRLVVVLGHSGCGAVMETLEELGGSGGVQLPNWNSITKRIGKSVEGLLATDLVNDKDSLMHAAVRANIEASLDYLREESEILRHLIMEDGLLVIGAEYSLESGEVDFFC